MRSIPIDDETFIRLEKYSKHAGLMPSETANLALHEWMDLIGDPILHEIEARTAAPRKKQQE